MRKKTGMYRKRFIGLCAAAGILSSLASWQVLGASLTDGVYTIQEGWTEDADLSTDTEKVYKKTEAMELEETSTISCSYIDTNYTALEYEDLRDMLTNELLYASPNAQISVSASYTDAKDYLYVLTADDAALTYREIYYYVVGDLKCFVTEVKEYREEAAAAQAESLDTPEAVGGEIARTFTWSSL